VIRSDTGFSNVIAVEARTMPANPTIRSITRGKSAFERATKRRSVSPPRRRRGVLTGRSSRTRSRATSRSPTRRRGSARPPDDAHTCWPSGNGSTWPYDRKLCRANGRRPVMARTAAGLPAPHPWTPPERPPGNPPPGPQRSPGRTACWVISAVRPT